MSVIDERSRAAAGKRDVDAELGSPNETIAAVAASIKAAATMATIVHIRAGLRRGRNGGSWAKAS